MVLNVKAVGVKGDDRIYGYVTEIELSKDGKPIMDYDFIEKVSSRITNEIPEMVKVLYVTKP